MERQINIEVLKKIALRAADQILEVYGQDDFNKKMKWDQSPVTEADLRSNEVILRELQSYYPQIPIISEESKIPDYEERRFWDCYFLVDPLDGTKEFIKRNGDFTVNIALIKNCMPSMGVVYSPVLKKMYCADLNRAWVEFDQKMYPLPLDNHSRHPKSSLTLVMSKSHLNQATKDFIENLRSHCHELESVSIGSSLKFCLVAEGVADLYPRLGPMCEWDSAAAHAVLLKAGGTILRINDGQPMSYNKKDLYNPHFIAFRNEFLPIIHKLLKIEDRHGFKA